MLPTLLLQTSWPTLHPALLSLFVAGLTFLAAWYWRGHDARKAARTAELAAAGRAEAERLEWVALLDRVAEVEASVGLFVEGEALNKHFEAIEARHKTTAVEVANQHNTLMEYLRERERLTGEFRGAITQLQKESRTLEPLPGQVADLKAKFEALTGQINDLKTGQRELKQELREDMKNNKGEILAAIKDLKHTS